MNGQRGPVPDYGPPPILGLVAVAFGLLYAACSSHERTAVHAADAAQAGTTVSVDVEVARVRLEVRREYLRRAASCPPGPNDCTATAEQATQTALAPRLALASQAVAAGTESHALLAQAAQCPDLDPACVRLALEAAALEATKANAAALQLRLTRPETP